MPADELLAELRLGYKDFSLSVDNVVKALDTLENAADTSFAELNDQTKAILQEFVRGCDSASNAFGKFSGRLQSDVKKISLESIGNVMDTLSSKFQGVAQASAGLFGGAVGASAGFEVELNKINTIANLSKEQLAAYGENLKVVSREMGIGVGPTQAAASAYEVLSNGFTNAQDGTKVMVAALRLAKGGFADAGESTKLLAGLLNSYGASADQAGRYSDILFNTVSKGSTTVPELVSGLGQLSSIAATANVSVEEMAAALGAATNNGQQTSTAIAGVRGIINALIKPSKEASDAMAAYGLNINGATLQQKGLAATLKEIKAAVGGNITAFKTIIPDTEAFATAAALTKDNVKSFSDILESNKNSLGATGAAIAQTSSGFTASTEQFKASMEGLKITAGQTILPTLTSIVKAGTSLVDLFGKLPLPVQKLGLSFAGLVGVVGGLGGLVFGLGAAVIAANAQFLSVGINIPKMAVSVAKTALAYTNAAAAISGYGNAQNLLFRYIAPNLGIMGGLAVAIGAITLAYSDLLNETTNADIALSKSQRGVSEYFGEWRDGIKELRTQDAVGLSVGTLADLGVGSKDIGLKIAEERNKLDTLPTAETIKAGPNASAELAKADAERKQILQNIQDLQKQRRDLEAELQKRANAPALAEQNQIAAKKNNEERYKDELQLIELSKVGHAEKIAQLNLLKSRYELDGNERRALEKKIAEEEDKLLKEKADKDKKARAEIIASRRQEIENSTKPEAAKIAALKDFMAKFKLTEAERRSIEDKILSYEQSLNRKREADFKKVVDFQLAQSNRRLKEVETDNAKLELKADKGVDVTGERAANIKKTAAEQTKQVDIELAKSTQGVTDPEALRLAQENAKAAKVDIAAKANIELDRLEAEGVKNEIGRRQEVLSAEEALKSRRIDLIREQVAAGKASEETLKKAVLDRLALQEQEIALQATLAKQQTEDPTRIAQIEEAAQGKIADARRAARSEIEATTKALEEQQKKEREAKSEFTLGKVTGVEGLNDTSAFDITKGTSKATDSTKFLRQLDTSLIDQSILNDRKPGSRALYDMQQRGGAIAQQVPTKTTLEIILKDKDGKPINFDLGKNDLNGQNSQFHRLAKGLGA